MHEPFLRLTLGEESEGMRVVLGAISLLVGPPGAKSSGPLGLETASGWLAPPPPPLLFELPMLPLVLVCWRWALEEPEAEGVDDTRERKLGITRCLKSRTSKLDHASLTDALSLQESHLQVVEICCKITKNTTIAWLCFDCDRVHNWLYK